MAVRVSATISMLCGALLVGACALPDTESFRAPDASNLFRRLSVTSYKDKELPPVMAADLVDTGGNCPGAYVPASGDQPGGGDVTLKEAGVPMIPASIGLEMTECDVVKRAGIPDRVEIGNNDRRERATTLTYTRGDRPGAYTFVDGRLKSMEMVAGLPEPPQKTAKKQAKPAKPAKRAAQPSQVSVQ
jgi:hypothetical protein